MGTAGFRIDLNFAFVMYCKLQETQFGKLLEQMEEDVSHMALLNTAQDIVFQETIQRNFSPCPVDEQYFIFKDNPEDSILPQSKKRLSQRSNAPSNPAKRFNELDKLAISSKYKADLRGTPDAFSDAESERTTQEESKKPLDS